ncbi:MAG: glycosyltransferase family 1 protein [bacterium]|nr:glycosyltransferase family 1 protein [bacterium]
MTHIGIDCRFSGTHSGLGRYSRELVTHLVSISSDTSYTLFVRSISEPWLILLPDSVKLVEVDIPHYSLAEQFLLSRFYKKADIDILLSPHFNTPFFYHGPFVIVIHDLILHRYPNNASFIKRCAYKVLLYRALRRAKKVIAVSTFTATEISRMYGKRIAKKVQVVGEGVSDAFAPASKERISETLLRHNLSCPFFLYVGNAKEHKNVQKLIDAHKKSGTSISLVLVSNPANLTLHDSVTVLSNIHDDDLPSLYSAATAFVSASAYEGYGLPFIEARACGCPVIGITGSSVDEVVSEGGLLLENSDDALILALQNPPTVVSTSVPQWSKAASLVHKLLQELTA